MLFLNRLLVSTGLALTMLLVCLITLMRTTLAARAGEIAFENNRDGNWDIVLLDVQTGITHNLTNSPSDDYTPSWSPDGSRLAFISDRDADNNPEVYIIHADGSHLTRLRDDVGIYGDPTWTADGRSLVLTHGWQQIFRVDLETRAEHWLGLGFAPRLSSDNETLLFYNSDERGVNSSIFRISLSDNRMTELTTGATHNWDADWSPNGQQIVFVSSRTGRPAIYVMNADGSDVRLISGMGYDLSPAWSANGEQIVYSSGQTGMMRLFVSDADGTNRRPLTSLGSDSHAPAWRPQPP